MSPDLIQVRNRLLAVANEHEPSEISGDIIQLCRALDEATKNSERMKWLHTCGIPGQSDKDKDGYEWGVARVKYDEHGQVCSALWTDSDSSDLDAAMAAKDTEEKP